MNASKLSPEQIEQLTQFLNVTMNFIKTTAGIANNAAWQPVSMQWTKSESILAIVRISRAALPQPVSSSVASIC